MNLPKLRIYRKSRWEFDPTHGPMRFGGENSYKLVQEDELQFQNEDGGWEPIPVAAEEVPPSPNEIRRQERMGQRRHDIEAVNKAMREAAARPGTEVEIKG